ncbi:MAG: hypothetical protein MJZ60_09405 [Bacteroidaceae bacterium]|nr:hypothetical protein [Bacteroidaceae bacterium]
MEQSQFKETVLLVDANYLDVVAGEMRAFLSGEAKLQVPVADLPVWMVNATMGVLWEKSADEKPDYSQQEVQIVLVCEKERTTLQNFVPSDLMKEVDGMAFREEQFGEFQMSVVQDEHLLEGEPLMVESVEMLLTSRAVKHLIVVADPDKGMEAVRDIVKNTDKDVELLDMRAANQNGKPSVLGISLLYALGISPEQLGA